jgi:hypothetical protein
MLDTFGSETNNFTRVRNAKVLLALRPIVRKRC